MTRAAWVAPLVLLAGLPIPAYAHLVNSGLGPFYDGVLHLLQSPGDLLGLLALALLAGMRGTTAARAVVIALPITWLLAGLIGLAALVQVAATLPANYIAFEYPVGRPDWWYDIVTGLPDPIVVDSFIEVWDRPGMGVDLIPEAAQQYLPEGDEDFFD